MKIKILIICFLFGFNNQTLAEELRIGFADSTGLYKQYYEQILKTSNIEGIEFIEVQSSGSKELVNLLANNAIDLAIIQSDIAFYSFEGIRGYKNVGNFSLVLPLYEEYMQILVSAQSDINTLGQLFEGNVSAGLKGSGGQQAAGDLFAELGFRPGIDFNFVELSVSDAMSNILAGKVKGLIYMGGNPPLIEINELNKFRLLDIPESILESLTIKTPSYKKTKFQYPHFHNDMPINTVSVNALLVASNNIDSKSISKIIRGIQENNVRSLSYYGNEVKTKTIDGILSDARINLHKGLKRYLREEGIMARDYTLYITVFIGITLILLVTHLRKRVREYDRVGNLILAQNTSTLKLYQITSKFGSAIIVVSIFLLLITFSVEAIKYFETEYAKILNIKNPFAERNFSSLLLWAITYMGAGDPGDLYPNSQKGKMIASILPFLGIGAVLGFGYSAVEQRRERLLKAREGVLSKTIHDHVLICGWNEKAKGIIYSLTSSDAPRKRQIVVVAELDGYRPLDQYGFDYKYVSYCKGDSADHKALQRANAMHADVAIVLAGQKKIKGRNIKSVLSTMALRQNSIKKDKEISELFIISELKYQDNLKLFEECGANTIVSSQLISDRVAAITCACPLAVDFLLDMLTYDERSELYTLPVKIVLESISDITKSEHANNNQNINIGNIADNLFRLGVNVVAINKNNFKDNVLLDHVFTGNKYQLIKESCTNDLDMSDELLVIADDFNTVVKHAKIITPDKNKKNEINTFSTDINFKNQPKKIALIGDEIRCNRVIENLSEDHEVIIMPVLSINNEEKTGSLKEEYLSEDYWKKNKIHEVDQITILSGTDFNIIDQAGSIDMVEADAQTLVIARFARNYLDKHNSEDKKIIIVAEMLYATNGNLFLDANVDIVIPTDLLIERVFSKLVFSRGSATRFLMALMNLKGKKYLYSQKINDEHKELIGLDMISLWKQMPNNFQLLGVLPGENNGRENWRNKVGDFSFHFLTNALQNGASSYCVKEGDEIIGIMFDYY